MWELLMTILFVQVMYASVFVRPGHGDVASLAPGLALFAALATGMLWSICMSIFCVVFVSAKGVSI